MGKDIVECVNTTLQLLIESVLVAMLFLEQRDAITKEDKEESGMSKTEFESEKIEMLKTKFFEKSTCYFCGDVIHNYELITLFDERNVKSCFECYNEVEIVKMVYYCKLAGIDMQWN